MTTEKRLIDANALIEHLTRSIDAEKGLFRAVCVAIKCFVEQMPTVDAVEVVHGRWEQARYTEAPLHICSECDKPEYKQHNYCPNCGAKMDGDGDG